MFSILKKSLDIDITYTTNSFIYIIRNIPIIKNIIPIEIYKDNYLKQIIKLFITIYLLLKVLVLKFFYYFLIFTISYYLFPKTFIKSYFHIFFILTILGIFINNKLLNTNTKNYISVILFQMDGTKYFRSMLIFNQLSNLLLNIVLITFFGSLFYCPLKYSITFIILIFFSRLIGELLNILFYKKYNYIWYSNTKLYGTVLLLFGLLLILPFLGIYVSLNIIHICTIVIVIIGLFSFYYLLTINDYKLMYRKLSNIVSIMNNKNDKDYWKQMMVEIKEKDKIIDSKKIEGKKGYDLFNTIFYERHKEILIRSTKKYTFASIIIYIIFYYLIITNNSYSQDIINFFNNKMGWFVIIMYIINRGGIITQAMFFNCDHAMLNYNFYREKKSLLELFKRRLLMLIKVNLVPAIIIGIGNSLLFIIINQNVTTIITCFIYIICLSIFFSIHYLVIYYLLQPFNKDLEVKKISYSIATMFSYILSYTMATTIINTPLLSIIWLIITPIYAIIALNLVYSFADKTFKLN